MYIIKISIINDLYLFLKYSKAAIILNYCCFYFFIVNEDILPEITEHNVNYNKEGEIKCLNID